MLFGCTIDVLPTYISMTMNRKHYRSTCATSQLGALPINPMQEEGIPTTPMDSNPWVFIVT